MLGSGLPGDDVAKSHEIASSPTSHDAARILRPPSFAGKRIFIRASPGDDASRSTPRRLVVLSAERPLPVAPRCECYRVSAEIPPGNSSLALKFANLGAESLADFRLHLGSRDRKINAKNYSNVRLITRPCYLFIRSSPRTICDNFHFADR